MLTGALGTGGSILVGGVAWLLAKERHHLPGGKTSDIVLALAVIGMLLAGDLTCYLGIGGWIVSAIHGIEGVIGPVGKVVLALLGLWLLWKIVKAVWKQHGGEAALWVAFAFPIISAAINSGIFLSINQQLKPPADAVQAALRAKLGA